MDRLSIIPTDAAHDQRLLALSQDLLGAVGPDGSLRPANPAWTDALGWTDEHLRTTPFLDLVTPEDRPLASATLNAAAAGRAGAFEGRVRCAEGGERAVHWIAESSEADDAVLLAGRDLSERRRLEQELQEFVYTASHDLAEPLRMVSSYLELLQRRYQGELDETADEFIGFAVGGAVRMRTLIDDLLSYSRVGSHQLEIASIDLAGLLTDVVGGLEHTIAEVGATVDLAGVRCGVRGDGPQIAQLLQHVVGNAVKFRDPDRPALVTITAVEDHGGVLVEVADNGIGIAEHQQDRVFGLFSRLHGREDYEGTGIGLALCRRIADRHGGRIWLDSSPGDGSAVHVWLPGRP